MGEQSKIEWTHTFNPWWGCMRVSPGCEHCYAEAFAKRTGHKVWGPEKTTERRFFGDKHWAEPVKWNAAAEKARERQRVFCASMADVFEEREDLEPHRERLFRLIEQTPSLDWLLLTKRPENMVRLAAHAGWVAHWPTNVWAGTTCEDQEHANHRVQWLLDVPARIRFVSYEPALGPIDFTDLELVAGKPPHGPRVSLNALTGHVAGPDDMLGKRIDWIIVGGESGGGSRPFDVAWARDVVAQCKAAGVACFVKQMGAKPYDSNVNMGDYEDVPPNVLVDVPRGAPISVASAGLRFADAKGGNIHVWPSELRVREFPR